MTEQRRSYAGECVSGGAMCTGNVYGTCVCHKRSRDRDCSSRARCSAASLPRWFPGATLYSVYEAGFSAFVLHRVLTKAGISNIVVNPASIAVAANDKVKTDRRDAKKLAIDLADGRLRGIYVPTEAEELARLLPRTRAQIVEHRATIARQIRRSCTSLACCHVQSAPDRSRTPGLRILSRGLSQAVCVVCISRS